MFNFNLKNKLFNICFRNFIMVIEIIEFLSCFSYSFSLFIFPLISIATFLYLLFFNSKLYWLPIAYLLWWLIIDRETFPTGGRPWSPLRKLSLFSPLSSYFPVKLYKTHEIDHDRNYIFAFHPHGYLVHGGFINFLTEATGFNRLFPHLKTFFTIVNGHFFIPFHRDLFLALGFISPAKKGLECILNSPEKGKCVVIVVGGAKEIEKQTDTNYTLHILNRKGFIKLALETGYVGTFGNILI